MQAGLGLVAALILGFALATSVTRMSFDAPSAVRLAEACMSFALPHASFASFTSLALGSLAVAVLILGARSAARQMLVSRRLLLGLRVHHGGPHGALAFECSEPQAFSAGLLRPRIYLSTGAIAALTSSELGAVLAHETHHVRARDPLRLFVVRVVSDALFFLPAARKIADGHGALAELAADGTALRNGGPQPLASALLAFEAAGPPGVSIAPERVDHLLGERPAWHLPLALIAWSVAALTAVAAVAVRLEAAHDIPTLNIPLLVAETCMLLMAVLPLIVGGLGVLGARQAVSARRSI